ncbi:MAG: hypothetical protein K8S98_14480 [Planctomycetes bacterium]|nr:hypothetical protein [Planctomycetota bacterium]
MKKRIRIGLAVVATTLIGAVVTAAVREKRAEAEFERCKERWPAPVNQPVEDAVSIELATLDRDLKDAMPEPDVGIFSPYRWVLEYHEQLEFDLARVEPLVERMTALLESPEVRRRIECGEAVSLVPSLRTSMWWANLLGAKAILAPDDADAARWIARGFDLHTLRCGTSAIGMSIHVAMDGITFSAMRVRARSAGFDPTPFLALVDPLLARRVGEVPWRELANDEVACIAADPSYWVREASVNPLEQWGRAKELNAVTKMVHEYETLAEGRRPVSAPGGPQMTFDILETCNRRIDVSVRLARLALRIADFERELGRLPATLDELDSDLDASGLRYTLAGDGAVLEVPDGRAQNEHWTIAGP